MEKVDEIPVYGKRIHALATWFWWTRWYFNLVLFVIPWAIYYALCLAFNLFINITWNRWWAGGNLYLVLNTAYHVLMGLHSVFLAFEFEDYLRYTRYIRPFA